MGCGRADNLYYWFEREEAPLADVEPALADVVTGREIRTVADPAALVTTAAEHRLTGLLWQVVQSDVLTVDEVQKKRMAISQVRLRSRQAQIVEALPQLLEDARSVGVRLVLFKGAALEAQLYGGSGLRPFTDLDVAVAPESRHRFGELVAKIDPSHALAESAQRFVDAGILDSVDLKIGDIWIDLHVDPFKVGLELLRPDLVWNSTEVVTVADVDVEVLGLESATLQMMLHELKDRFSFLIGHSDLMRLCTHPDLDRTLLAEMIQAQGYGSLFTFVMDVVEGDLGVDVHPTDTARGWRHAVARRVWPATVRLGGGQGRRDHHRRQQFIPFLAKGRVREALRWWRRVVFPPAELLQYWGELLHPHLPPLRGPYLWKLLSRRWHLFRDRHSSSPEEPR
jgi:Uncharacterised nucleotidyltransferase